MSRPTAEKAAWKSESRPSRSAARRERAAIPYGKRSFAAARRTKIPPQITSWTVRRRWAGVSAALRLAAGRRGATRLPR